MSQSKFVGVLTALLFCLVIGSMSVFTVQQNELALILRFGKIISGDYAPGLHFKMPMLDSLRIFDARIQNLDAEPAHFLTKEKKNLIVDSYAKWKIIDLNTYYTSVSGSTDRAGKRLAEIIADGLRSEFGKRTIQEVVSGDRAQIMDLITQQANQRIKQFGIEVIDVRIKRIELPKEVSTSVFRRMEAERERDAKNLRSQGEAEALKIQAEADRGNLETLANAERDAEQIRGEGDAQASEIYARSYGKNPEFYGFYRSLMAYRKSFSNKNDILVLQPESEFFGYFNQLKGSTTPELPPMKRE